LKFAKKPFLYDIQPLQKGFSGAVFIYVADFSIRIMVPQGQHE